MAHSRLSVACGRENGQVHGWQVLWASRVLVFAPRRSSRREATRLDLRVKHASNELMNATTAPVVPAAFEDPDEVLEFAISIGLYNHS